MDSLTKLILALTALIKVLTPPKTSTAIFRIFITLFLVFISVIIIYKPKTSETDVFDKSNRITMMINLELERIRAKNGAGYCAVYIAHNGKKMLNGSGLYYLDQTFMSDCKECQYQANVMQNLPSSQFSLTIEVLKQTPYLYSKNLNVAFLNGYRDEPTEFFKLRKMLTSYGTKSIAIGGIFCYRQHYFGHDVDGKFHFSYVSKDMLGFMTLEFANATDLKTLDLKCFESDIRFIEAKINKME